MDLPNAVMADLFPNISPYAGLISCMDIQSCCCHSFLQDLFSFLCTGAGDDELVLNGDNGYWGEPRGEKYLALPMASSAKSRNSCDGSADILAYFALMSGYGFDAGDKFQASVLTTSWWNSCHLQAGL